MIMTIAFIMHLLIARLTKLKYVYLTGHLMWWVSLTVVVTILTIKPHASVAEILGTGSIVMALYWSIQPAYIHKAMSDVMGSPDIAYGHTSSLAVHFAYKSGKYAGKPRKALSWYNSQRA